MAIHNYVSLFGVVRTAPQIKTGMYGRTAMVAVTVVRGDRKEDTMLLRTSLKYSSPILFTQDEDLIDGISEGKERLSVGYESTFYQEGCPEDGQSLAKSLQEKLMSSRREDLYTGHTGVGPHRDDLRIEIDGRSARSFGSQGQQRSCVLALKLAEASLLYRLLGERPVVLLDDVMSELDQSRQDYLLNHIEGWQVFITCCDPDTVGRLEGGAIFQVEGGVISQVSGEKEGKSVI